MVAPWGAKAATPSLAAPAAVVGGTPPVPRAPGGIEAAVRPDRRVSTTLWLTPGTVSSRARAAAAAATDDTPGTTSKERCSARHQSICSAMAP